MNIKTYTLNVDKRYILFNWLSVLIIGVLLGIISTKRSWCIIPIAIVFLLLIKKAKEKVECLIGISAIIGMMKNAPIFSIIQSKFDLTLLIEMLLLLSLLIDVFINEVKFKIDSKIRNSVMLFIVIASISLLFIPSGGDKYCLDKYIQFVYMILISKVVITHIYIVSENQISNILGLYLIFGVIVSAYAFITNTRESFLSTYISTTSSAIIAMVICFSYYMNKNNQVYLKILYLLLGIFLMYIAFFAGARGPVISVVLAYILYGILEFILNHKFTTLIKYIAIISFVIIIIALSKDIILQSNFGKRFSIIADGMNTGDFGESGGDRIYNGNIAINLIKNNLFTGVGIGSYSYYVYGTFERLYPHNIFLEIASELGIISVVILVILIIYIEINLIKLMKNNRSKIISKVIFILFNMMLIEAQFSGNLLDNKLLFLFMGISSALNNLFCEDELSKR